MGTTDDHEHRRSNRQVPRCVLVALLAAAPAAAPAQSLEVDRKLGAEGTAEVAGVYGIVQHPEATAYVAAVGRRLVATLGEQPFEYSFQIVNITQPNAFALPAGHVFVSPSLLVLAQSEHELAGILAHEIVHAHRRHSVQQMKKGGVPGILKVPGKVVGSIVPESLGRFIDAPFTTLDRLRKARYSRGMEKEADLLGIELAAKAGYDPSALARLLVRRDRGVEIVSGEHHDFSHFDDHPFTPERARDVRTRAVELTPADTPPLAPGPAELLAQLDGLPIGPDPAHGTFHDNAFFHPELGFAFWIPPGWNTFQRAEVVGGYEPEGEAQVFLGLVQGEPEDLAASFIEELKQEHGTEPTRVEAFEAGDHTGHLVAVEDEVKGRPVSVHAVWMKVEGRTYEVLAFGDRRHEAIMKAYALLLRPLHESERQSLKGLYLRGAIARAGDTLASLKKREKNALRLEVTAVLNDIAADATLVEGQVIRIGRREPYRPTPEGERPNRPMRSRIPR